MIVQEQNSWLAHYASDPCCRTPPNRRPDRYANWYERAADGDSRVVLDGEVVELRFNV